MEKDANEGLYGLIICNSQLSRKERRVGLVAVDVRARGDDFCSHVTVCQEYVNKSHGPIDTKYVFPLPEDASVCSFTATIGDTIVKAIVKEKKEAKADFEKAKREFKTAALLEKDQDDVFVTELGNVDKDQTCKIEIGYVCENKLDGRHARLTLPMVVMPRYSPAADLAPSTDASASRVLGADLPYRFTFVGDFSMPSRIVEISSTHAVTTKLTSERRAIVSLGDKGTCPDRDFAVLIEQADPFRTRAILEVDPDNHTTAVQLTFCPALMSDTDVETMDLQNEFVIIVDRSGSMAGVAIDRVRDTLRLSLRALPTASKFNIIGFGSTVDPLFAQSVKYTEAHVEIALEYVNQRVHADLGGTELLQPLRAALRAPVVDGYPRQILLLTDGAVTNVDEIVAEVKQNAHSARVFTFGIGAAVSHALVKSIARAGNGECELVTGSENISEKVLRQISRALQPAMCNISVDWTPLSRIITVDKEGDKAEGKAALNDADKAQMAPRPIVQCPRRIPPVFSASRNFVYALNLAPFDQLPDAGELSVRALSNRNVEGSDCFTIKIPFNKADFTKGKLVHQLAARARVRELEHCEAVGDGDAKEIEGEMIQLGTKYNLASRHTSFVAIFEQSKVHGAVRKVNVPLAAPESGDFLLSDLVERQSESISLASAHIHRGGHLAKKSVQALSASIVERSNAALSFSAYTEGVSKDARGPADGAPSSTRGWFSRAANVFRSGGAKGGRPGSGGRSGGVAGGGHGSADRSADRGSSSLPQRRGDRGGGWEDRSGSGGRASGALHPRLEMDAGNDKFSMGRMAKKKSRSYDHPRTHWLESASSSKATASASSASAGSTSASVTKSVAPLIKPTDRESATVCNFTQTGKDHAEMDVYHCRTCNLIDDKLCCRACALICHKDHDVVFKHRSNAFCDCAIGLSGFECKTMPKSSQQKLIQLRQLLVQLIGSQRIDGSWASATEPIAVLDKLLTSSAALSLSVQATAALNHLHAISKSSRAPLATATVAKQPNASISEGKTPQSKLGPGTQNGGATTDVADPKYEATEATWIAVQLLETAFEPLRVEWNLMALKGKAFLRSSKFDGSLFNASKLEQGRSKDLLGSQASSIIQAPAPDMVMSNVAV